MTGFLLVSHGTMAKGVFDATDMIMGHQDKVLYCNLETDIQIFKSDIDIVVEKAMKRFDELIIICDIKSGTPYNESMRIALSHEGIRVLTGLNLPMVLEMLAMSSFMNGDELVQKGLEAGRIGVSKFEVVEDQEDEF